jgi:hypothetical protein
MRAHSTVLIAMMAWAPSLCVAQAHAELDIGGVRARFYSNGRVSADTVISGPQFEVPVGEANALYAGGLWIAGQTSSNQTRVSRTLFDSGGTIQFFPGPLRADGTASTDQQTSALYDRVWKVSREQVATHLAYYNCLSDPACDINVEFPLGYTIPADIAEWPAMGNSMDGYAVFLAPFYDYNLDGNYVAAEGDAPCIIGDQALFSVFSDRLSTQFGNEPLGVEVHQMPFAYATGDPMLERTVFIRYHLINRSTETYANTMLGFFNDFDLGCADDDFIGCDPARNLSYIYNWDDVDENCLGSTGYQEQPPAFGMQLLKGPLMDATGLDEPVSNYLPNWNGHGFGDGIPDNERLGLSHFMYFNRQGPSCCDDPATPGQHFNYLRGIWKDGVTMSYGGVGYNPDPGALACAFMYPGAGDPVGAGTGGQVQGPWYDISQVLPDRRGLMSMGAFELAPGEHVDLLFAYVYARASSGGAMASVTALQQRADSVAAFAQTLPVWSTMEELGFNGQCADYLTLGVDEVPGMGQLVLAPSPASDIVHFMAARELVGGLLTVRDATGRVVHQQRVWPERNTIHLCGFANGVYLCEAVSRNARYTGRLVKE